MRRENFLIESSTPDFCPLTHAKQHLIQGMSMKRTDSPFETSTPQSLFSLIVFCSSVGHPVSITQTPLIALHRICKHTYTRTHAHTHEHTKKRHRHTESVRLFTTSTLASRTLQCCRIRIQHHAHTLCGMLKVPKRPTIVRRPNVSCTDKTMH